MSGVFVEVSAYAENKKLRHSSYRSLRTVLHANHSVPDNRNASRGFAVYFGKGLFYFVSSLHISRFCSPPDTQIIVYSLQFRLDFAFGDGRLFRKDDFRHLHYFILGRSGLSFHQFPSNVACMVFQCLHPVHAQLLVSLPNKRAFHGNSGA